MSSDKEIAEKAKKIGVPVIPKKLPIVDSEPIYPPDSNPVIAVCGECGREIRSVEWYSCPQSNCPVQIKP